MLVKGSFVTEMSGSIAGITASHNRGGQYLRARLVPTDPVSDLQASARARLGALTARWLVDLSESQRDAWNLYADNTTVLNKLGDPIKLSGHQHFVRSNTAALQGGVAQINDGPTIFGTGELVVIDTITLNTVTAGITVVTFPAGTTLLLYAGRPQNASVSFFRGPYRFVTSDTVSPVSDAQPYGVAAGQRQWVYARFLNDDGRLSGQTFGGPEIVTVGP